MTTKYEQQGAAAAVEDGRAGSAGADLDVEALLQHLGLDSGGAEEAAILRGEVAGYDGEIGVEDARYEVERGYRSEIPRDDLAITAGLCPLGQAAAAAILAVLRREDRADAGGCRAFYSPAEWDARGEAHGRGSVLVVVHDGGDHGSFFAYEREDYEAIDRMANALRPLGLYSEQATVWYSAVYRIAG
jgi:hypothetical protein